jgi:hypothetical protein
MNTKNTTLRNALVNANNANLDQSVSPLTELWSLRKLIKAAEERLKEISDDALQEALTYTESGQFMHEGHTFQIQQTDVFDMSNYNRYKGEDAIRWRSKKEAQAQARKYAAALTKEMDAIVKSFITLHPEWTPDEVKLTVKVID